MFVRKFGRSSAELSDKYKVQKFLTKEKVQPNRTFGRSLSHFPLFFGFFKISFLQFEYSKSSIIGNSITVILAIPGLIKYSIYSSNSLIIGITILGIVVPRLSGFRLSGTFFGPSHPDNRGPPVMMTKMVKSENVQAFGVVLCRLYPS